MILVTSTHCCLQHEKTLQYNRKNVNAEAVDGSSIPEENRCFSAGHVTMLI